MSQTQDQLELNLLTQWLDSSDLGLLVVDQSLLVVMLNNSAAKFLRTSALQALNAPIDKVLRNARDYQSIISWLQSPNGVEEHYTLVPRIDQYDRDTRLLLKLSMKQVGSQMFRALSITDVTELLNAKESLEAMRRQWQAVNAGVVVVDATEPDLPIVHVNQMFEQMTGYESHEIVGRNCRFLQRDDNDQVGLQVIRKALLAKTNGYAVIRNYRKDGTLFYNELFISPVRNADGLVTHFVGVQHMRDESYKTSGLLPEGPQLSVGL